MCTPQTKNDRDINFKLFYYELKLNLNKKKKILNKSEQITLVLLNECLEMLFKIEIYIKTKYLFECSK